jgi:hypothetical protein
MDFSELFKKEDEEKNKNVEYAKKRLKAKPLNEEKIYGKIGKALEKSSVKGQDDFRGWNSLKTLFPDPPISPKENPDTMAILETIPVDDKRNIEIRVDPRKKGKFTYVATKSEILPNEYVKNWDLDWPPPIPEMTKKDIASLSIMEDGYTNFVKSSRPGAKEKAVERLMMEAAKRDMVPYSDELLQPGENLVGKIKKEYELMPREEYLNKIKNFLKTGKTGKIWSAAAPYLGGAVTAAGGLGYSDLAGAATDLAIPGGVEELGVADERSISDPRYQEYIRKMQAKGKK